MFRFKCALYNIFHIRLNTFLEFFYPHLDMLCVVPFIQTCFLIVSTAIIINTYGTNVNERWDSLQEIRATPLEQSSLRMLSSFIFPVLF